ncbi:MAG: Jag N-terminal domain-containing protein [Clostridia bacterium]|nr:Jag N-terminal domain-containing protein [Clostridia bacterium]
MIKEAIGTGATIEQAIEEAKKALNAPEDADVSTEIIEMPQKKLFGLFGGSPAKARAYYEYEEKKPEPKKSFKAQKEKSQPKKADFKKPEPVVKEEKVEEPKTYTGVVSEIGKAAECYVKGILSGMGVDDVEIMINEDEESISIDLDCGNGYGYVIGRRGETLDAIQYLTRLAINKGKDNYKRVSINAGNYREKREDTLKELARKQASRVKKYGRSVCLDPMNPYERRIIHTTIQEIDGVSSHSVGSEADRKVVITPADGGYRNSNSRGRSGGKSDYRRKPSNNYVPAEDKPARAPRSDFGGSLYGKIEPKKVQKTEE